MPSHDLEADFQRDIYSVSRLNSEVRSVLEGSFPLLWVEGEISNLASPNSGHIYFSLKDPHAQVRCAMFRMKRQYLRFQPTNGLKVLIRARVGLYEGRGEFQLIAEHMEPAGEGDLRQAFEKLKQDLQTEGLFDIAHKQALPKIPKQIGIITSPTGAAIQDVITVLKRRFPAVPLLIYPVAVQGEEAPRSILNALRLAERRRDCDLLILTRGGGSLEDLMAFNDEAVARAIHKLSIPLISAVGHEIDFTIADFVADQRAPTPSVAADLATPDQQELLGKLSTLNRRVILATERQAQHKTTSFRNLDQRLKKGHPGMRLQQQQQYLDDLHLQLNRRITAILNTKKTTLEIAKARLQGMTPSTRLKQRIEVCTALRSRLQKIIKGHVKLKRQDLGLIAGKLNTLSPLGTLDRGYSITRLLPSKKVLSDVKQTQPGDTLETRISNGHIISTVLTTSTDQ